MNFTVQAEMHLRNVACKVKTMFLKNELTSSAKMNVYYSVQTVTYAPISEVYNIGSSLKCSADCNPKAMFEWKNIDNPELIVNNNILYINKDMTGQNRWKCTAQNSINDKVYKRSITAEFEVVTENSERGFKAIFLQFLLIKKYTLPMVFKRPGSLPYILLGLLLFTVICMAFILYSEYRCKSKKKKKKKENEPNVTEPLNSDEKENGCKGKKENPEKIASAEVSIEMQCESEPLNADEEGNQCEGKNENPFVNIEMQPEREPLTHNADECEDQRKSKKRNSKSLKRNTSAEDIFFELQQGKKTLALTNERHSEV